MAATLSSFAIYAGFVVYIFAAASAARALLIVMAIGAAAGAFTWASILSGGRL